MKKKLQKSERGKAEREGEGSKKKERIEERGKVVKAAKSKEEEGKSMEMKID